MAKPRIGMESIIYGERARTDFAGMVAEIERLGYDGLEHAPPEYAAEVDKFKAALDGRKVEYIAGHAGLGSYEDPAALKQYIEGVKALGGRYLIASGWWSEMEGYRKAAKLMNEIGKRCRDAGLTFCYHNHANEFDKIDGVTPLHVMIQATDPTLVKLCPDVYWVDVGGEKPSDYISHYKDRCHYFHFKDGTGTEFRELGRGRVDIPAALKAALAAGAEWIVVEQDQTQLEPAESNRISREYLRSLGV